MYRVRLRFYITKPLDSDLPKLEFRFGSYPASLSSMKNESGQALRDSRRVVLNIREIENEEMARKIGGRAKDTLELISFISRIGVDTGDDKPTSHVSAELKAALEQGGKFKVRMDVHGVDVFEDSSDVQVFSAFGEGVVQVSSNFFLQQLDFCFNASENLANSTRDILRQFNAALRAMDPIAQALLAIACVEGIGQRHKWNRAQRELLVDAAAYIERQLPAEDSESLEVAEAIRSHVHRISLRRGVQKLFSEHGLSHLLDHWDRVYSERSNIVHGLQVSSGRNSAEWAAEAVSLCGHLLDKVVAAESELKAGAVANDYPVPSD